MGGFMQGGANNASLWQQPGGGPTIRTVPESDAMDQSQNGRGRQGNRRQNGNSNGYANIHSRDGGKGSKPQRPSPKKGKPSPTKGLFDLEETTTTTIIMVVVVVIIKEMAVLSVGQGMVDGNAKKKVFKKKKIKKL